MSKGRKTAAKQDDTIKLTFDTLNDELKKAGYELVIRRPVSKDLVVFDYGLLFTAGSNEIQIYVDDDLKAVIDHLLETNKQLIIKSNWLSPDTVAIKVPCDLAADTQSDGSNENVPE